MTARIKVGPSNAGTGFEENLGSESQYHGIPTKNLTQNKRFLNQVPTLPFRNWGWYYIILYYTILYYTIVYYTILYYTILYYTILYYTILYGGLAPPRRPTEVGYTATRMGRAVERTYEAGPLGQNGSCIPCSIV